MSAPRRVLGGGERDASGAAPGRQTPNGAG